jgi:hypothetical protein
MSLDLPPLAVHDGVMVHKQAWLLLALMSGPSMMVSCKDGDGMHDAQDGDVGPDEEVIDAADGAEDVDAGENDAPESPDGIDAQDTLEEDETPYVPEIKALYVWYYDSSDPDRLIELCGKEHIDTVYIGITDSIDVFENDPDAYVSLITRAQAAGIEIHGLLGSAGTEVLDNPALHRPIIEALLKFNAEHPATPFTGINFDIEGFPRDSEETNLHKYIDYISQLKTWAYGAETVLTQGLTLSIYYGAEDNATILELYHQFDLVAVGQYRDTPETYIRETEEGIDALEAEGIPFIIGFESDELRMGYWEELVDYFDDGKDAYHRDEAQLGAYYTAGYTGFKGDYLHHFATALTDWYMITDLEWPSGDFSPGETVTARVTVRTGHGYPVTTLRGVELAVRDGGGRTWKTSQILELGGRETRQVELGWQVPADAADGAYDAMVTTYDVDFYGDNHVSPLLDSWNLLDPANPITSYSLEDLSGLPSTLGDELTGKRDTFVVLDYDGWRTGVFRVTGGVVPPTTCFNGAVDAGEECDGDNLGDSSCIDQGFVGGTLACSSACTFDDSGCSNDPVFDFLPPTDADGAVVSRDWTEIALSVNGTTDSSAFIDWNRSLVGYWDFDETAGSSVQDLSSWGNDGTLTGGSPTAGTFGQALLFDGIDDAIEVPDSASLCGRDEVTIEAWVSFNSFQGAIAHKFDAGLSGDGYLLGFAPPDFFSYGNLMFVVRSAGTSHYLYANDPLEPGVWTHVAATFKSGGFQRLYINGRLNSYLDESITWDIGDSAGWDLAIGKHFAWYTGSEACFDGMMDEVRIWSRALSGEEILASYNSRLYALHHRFEGLADGTYAYYAYMTDVVGLGRQTPTRTVTIAPP